MNRSTLDVSMTRSSITFESGGSSLFGAIVNFTNCVIGAGIIGTGGAIAQSGYAVSVLTITICAVVTKYSLDLLIRLGEELNAGDYEALGLSVYGRRGKLAVIISKFLYAIGCTIAYVVVLKKNIPTGLSHVVNCPNSPPSLSVCAFIGSETYFTFTLCTIIILPLSLHRKLDKLAKFSGISIVAVLCIAAIIIYQYAEPSTGSDFTSISKDLLEIRAGYIQSLGTFVFAFVSQHTSHGVYRSLKDRSLSKWKTVSSVSMIIAYTTTVLVASISYFTFWDQTSSDLFTIYPQGKVVDAAKILLSVTMLLTFPMPFFTCRELFLVYWDMLGEEGGEYVEVGGTEDNEEPLLAGMEGGEVGRFNIVHFLSSDEHNAAAGGGDLQLQTRYHVMLTLSFWAIAVCVALAAPTLGDVLNIVGCATGSMIAFILPALFARKSGDEGAACKAMLAMGVVIAVLGTVFSVKSMVQGDHA